MNLTPEQIEDIATRAATRAASAAVESAARLAAERAVESSKLSRDDIEALTRQTVKDTVTQTLVQLGMDQQNPLEMQRDFQHLRQWRRAGEDMRSKGLMAILTIFITGVISLLVVGLRDWVHK